jgi:anti-sigma regulatory factor (Ser/Thr protein kinase)
MSSVEDAGHYGRCEPLAHSGRSAPLASPAGSAAHSDLLPGTRRCEWRLRSVESAVPWMRRRLRALLDDPGLSDDEREDLVLAACEAATNAVEHAQQPTEPFFDVCAEITDGLVTIVVRDHGRWREPTSSQYRGRGLAMMRVLADTTVTSRPLGTTVTLRSHRGGTDAFGEEQGRAS